MVAEADSKIALTTAEAAALAGVSDRTIRNWIKDGLLTAHKVGEGRRIHKTDLLAHLRERANNVAGVLGKEALTGTPAAAVTETAEGVSPSEAMPEPHQNGQAAPTHLRLVPQSHNAEADVRPEASKAAISGDDVREERLPTLTPELINMVLQPLREELEAERHEKRRLHKENIELAGRVGYYQAELAGYKERVLLLEAPKEASVVPQDKPEHKPWYKRLFGLE